MSEGKEQEGAKVTPRCPKCKAKMTETVSYNAKTRQQHNSWFCFECRTTIKRKVKVEWFALRCGKCDDAIGWCNQPPDDQENFRCWKCGLEEK